MAKPPTDRHNGVSAEAGTPVVASAAKRQNAKASARSARRSLVLSGIAVAGIGVFVMGAFLTVLGFFLPSSGNSSSFTAQIPGMKVATANVGLALAFLGLMFTAVVRLL